ncbi:MAG: hypothetical protein ACTSPZ_00490 [Promethearchaeota archaeon]
MSVKSIIIGHGAREHVIAETLVRDGAKLYAFMSSKNAGIEDLSQGRIKIHWGALKFTAEIVKKKEGKIPEEKLFELSENEILMKIWISEFKEIIRDFEKLKKLKPKEFSVRLNEISETIDIFKQKIMS